MSLLELYEKDLIGLRHFSHLFQFFDPKETLVFL